MKAKKQTVQQGFYSSFANMVTSYPLPEGFTEIEVFGIGTTLLVQGKTFFYMTAYPSHPSGKLKEDTRQSF